MSFWIILICVMIGVPCYLLGYSVGIPKRTKNIGNLYISKEGGSTCCYLALNDVDVLNSLHKNEEITLIVKYDSHF